MFRVVPYATQFSSYDKYKQILEKEVEDLPALRLLGIDGRATATSITYPLDTVRLRLSVQPELGGFADAVSSVWREGGPRTFYKGYKATLLSLCPFIAINFATFDQLKHIVHSRSPELQSSTLVTLGLEQLLGSLRKQCVFP